MFRLDFEYLNNLPVLILDVEDDFKNDRIKQEAIIDKVLSYFICLYFVLLFFTSEDLYSAILSDLESVFSCRSESFSPRCRNVCDVSSVICWLDDPVTHCKCFLLDCQNVLCFFNLVGLTPSGSVSVVLTMQSWKTFFFLLQSFRVLLHFICIYFFYSYFCIYLLIDIVCVYINIM